MTKEHKIIYEPHPVSPERKAELRAEGFTILDARFDPEPNTQQAISMANGVGTDSGDQLSDEQLRQAIEAATGKSTHPAMKRENLIAKFNKLNAEAASA